MESEGRRGKWRLMAIGSFAALVETEGRMEGGPDGHQVEEGRKGSGTSQARGEWKQPEAATARAIEEDKTFLQYRFTLWIDCERVFVHPQLMSSC